MVETKQVTDRRTVQFTSMDEILADVDALDGAAVTASGNWTPAQIVEHVTLFIDGSLDGFDIKAPFFLRLLGPRLKAGVLRKAMKAGFNLPGFMQPFVPAADVTWEAATDHLRTAIGRLRAGERMTHRSPVFGAMSHEDWVRLHCRHAELHFSFLKAGD